MEKLEKKQKDVRERISVTKSQLERAERLEKETDAVFEQMKARHRGEHKIIFELVTPDGFRIQEKPFLTFYADNLTEAKIIYSMLLQKTCGAFNNQAVNEHGSVGRAIRSVKVTEET